MNNKPIQTASNTPSQHAGGIHIKSKQELDHMRLAGQITGAALKKLRTAVVPGITTKELDRIAEKKSEAWEQSLPSKGIWDSLERFVHL